jgi:hypothetical protein
VNESVTNKPVDLLTMPQVANRLPLGLDVLRKRLKRDAGLANFATRVGHLWVFRAGDVAHIRKRLGISEPVGAA